MYKLLIFITYILLITFSSLDASDDRILSAFNIASTAAQDFIVLFSQCYSSVMPGQQFISDNIQDFVNYPSKTTVGFAPKLTNNRKFFANMLSTIAFKEMLANDEDEIRRDLVKKLKYCDEAVMDINLLKDMYDREVDQSKI